MCDLCPFRAKSFKKVAEHCTQEHQTKYWPYTCSECEIKGKGFHQFHQFRNHVETYHSGNKYICPYCGKDMPTDKKLQNHIMLNHEVDKTKKDFVCDLCGYATHLKVRQISVFLIWPKDFS